MKRTIYFIALLCINNILFGQNTKQDTIKLDAVIVTANRMPIILKKTPGAISLVTQKTLLIMPKTIGAEEALR